MRDLRARPAVFFAAIVAIAAVSTGIVLSLQGGLTVKTAGEAVGLVGYTYSFDVAGSIEVADPYSWGYDDIADGAQVEVINQQHDVLAVGYLLSTDTPGYFEFEVPAVPRGHDMYGVSVGNANRGVIWQSEQETESYGFQLTLG